jgi:hydroxypyruvate reductase
MSGGIAGSKGASAELRARAREVFAAGLRGADPRSAVHDHLRISPGGLPVIAGQELHPATTLHVVAFGKAGVTMAEAVSELLSPSLLSRPGVVTVNSENFRALDCFEVFASGHPVPDAVGVAAAAAMERYVAKCRKEDALLVLVSGGGSALLPAPAPGISLEDKAETTRLLLACGAPIQEINCIRKHLSRLKGGELARLASPARVEALILSDVIGDDVSSIASGPTAPDSTTFEDAATILTHYELQETVPTAVWRRLTSGAAGEIADTPSQDDPIFDRVENRVIGSNTQSLVACRQRAEELGCAIRIESEQLQGEAREAAAILHGAARLVGRPSGPLAILAGGETTVTLRGNGRGGRNQELALAFALLAEAESLTDRWVLLSGATDGRDGSTEAAGAVIDAGTLGRIRSAGLDPREELERNNSFEALLAADDLLVTGATGTNVADLQILLMDPGELNPGAL